MRIRRKSEDKKWAESRLSVRESSYVFSVSGLFVSHTLKQSISFPDHRLSITEFPKVGHGKTIETHRKESVNNLISERREFLSPRSTFNTLFSCRAMDH